MAHRRDLTAGSGITPVVGMLRDIEFDDVVMVHCAPQPQDVLGGRPPPAAGSSLFLHTVLLAARDDGRTETNRHFRVAGTGRRR